MNSSVLYAKSDGELLKNHLENVRIFALKIFSKTYSVKNFEYENIDGEKIVSITAKLHDICKATKGFQKILLGKSKKSGYMFSHGELAWAFIIKHIDLGLTNKEIEIIANNIYWHHGITNKMGVDNLYKIYSEFNEDDIETIRNLVIDLFDERAVLDEPREGDVDQTKTPLFYYSDKPSLNIANIIIRSCLLGADRLVSELGKNFKEDNIGNVIDFYLKKNGSYYLKDCPFDDDTRFIIQRNIVINSKNNTLIVKGPGGWGKTLLGLIWSSTEFSDKKTIIVYPTNTMSEHAYISVYNELENSNNLSNTSMELFLTGEIKNSHNKKCDEPFTSDIIITNIDNFLSLNTKNNESKNLFMLSGVDVIFDEFHEFVSNSALFSLFINVMKIRHQYTKSRTILLSATPMNLSYLWDTYMNKTEILPNENKHYSAIHNKKYKINTKIYDNVIDIIPNNNGNQLIKFNVIKNAQEYYTHIKDNHNSFIVHSKYEKDVVKNKIHQIFKWFGKGNNKNEKKPVVVSTPILQTSLDISFSSLIDMLFSFDSFLQAIARADRWGNLDVNIINVDLVKLNGNKSENMLIRELYSKILSELFFDLINSLSGKEMTINELYVQYNQFYVKHKHELQNFIRTKQNESLKNLEMVYPKRFFGEKNSDLMFAGGNKLRTTSNSEIWVVYQKNDGTFTEPFSVCLYENFSIEFDEPPNIETLLFDRMEFIQERDERYDYSKLIKKRKRSRRSLLEDIRKSAIISKTPYFVFNRIYDNELGIIKI